MGWVSISSENVPIYVVIIKAVIIVFFVRKITAVVDFVGVLHEYHCQILYLDGYTAT